MSSKIRVAILEDYQLTIDGYLFRLQDRSQFEVVGAARFGIELEPLLDSQATDVLLLDMNVPTAPDNPDTYPILNEIPKLLQKHNELSVLAVSMHADRFLIQTAIDLGVSGYILKDDSKATQELGSVILSVVRGGFYLSEKANQVLRDFQHKKGDLKLSERQLEALMLCANHPDKSLAELAQMLSVANSTIRNLLSNAYVKLEVNRREAAVAKARQMGLI